MSENVSRTAELTRGEWPAEVRDLPTDKMRAFVLYYCTHRNGARASKEAGYLPEMADALDHAQNAYKLLHREDVTDAVIAMTRRQLRTLAPEAINALKETLQSPFNKDRVRAAAMVLERTDAPTHKVDVTHTHRFDPIKITLGELARLKRLGANREAIMLALDFQSPFELEHYESLLAKDSGDVIEAEYVELPAPDEAERDPDADLLGE